MTEDRRGGTRAEGHAGAEHDERQPAGRCTVADGQGDGLEDGPKDGPEDRQGDGRAGEQQPGERPSGAGAPAHGGAGTVGSGSADRAPLARSERHRVVAGVCGGLGRHLDIDPVVFRVVVAVLCLSGGLGLFLYGLAWLIVPTESSGKTEIQRLLTGRVDAQSTGAVLLTAIGTGIFFSWTGHGDRLFPLLLLGVLVFFAVRYNPDRRSRESDGGKDQPLQPAPDSRHITREEARARRQQWRGHWHAHRELLREEWRERRAEARGWNGAPNGHSSATGSRWDPHHPEHAPYASFDAPPPASPTAWWRRDNLPTGDPLRKAPPPDGRPLDREASQRLRCRRKCSFLTPLALLLSLGAGAAVWVSRGAGGNLRPATVLATVLLVQGLALLLGTRRGRAHGLVVPALLTTLVLAAAGTTGHLQVETSTGARHWAPTTAAQVQSDYRLGAGRLTLDLTGIRPAGGTVGTRVRLGTGSLTVTVPSDVAVHLTARSSAGSLVLPDGSRTAGLDSKRTIDLAPAHRTAAKGTISLDLEVGLGEVKVVRR